MILRIDAMITALCMLLYGFRYPKSRKFPCSKHSHAKRVPILAYAVFSRVCVNKVKHTRINLVRWPLEDRNYSSGRSLSIYIEQLTGAFGNKNFRFPLGEEIRVVVNCN